MPLYEYECGACGERFELIRKFSDPPVDTCALCGKGPVQRLLSSPAIQFKGTGWYITDYAQKGKSAKADSSGDATAAEGKSDSASPKKESTAKGEAAAKKDPTARAAASSTTNGAKD